MRRAAGLGPGEGEQEVREITLGIDEDGRDAVDRRFLDQGQAEAGLAAAGHAHADRVGDQIPRVVEDEIRARFSGRGVEGSPEVEHAQLLVVRHGRPSPPRE